MVVAIAPSSVEHVFSMCYEIVTGKGWRLKGPFQPQRKRQRQNQSSRVELNSSSKNSSKKVVLVIVSRLFGKPNETVRDMKRGSATDLEPIGCAMMFGLSCEPRRSRS
jgi:hypothetical protein